MLRMLFKWWRDQMSDAPSPPLQTEGGFLAARTPKIDPRPPRHSQKLLATAPFNAQAPLPAAVREFKKMDDRRLVMWDGKGFDGVIPEYRAMRIERNRTDLHKVYLQTLQRLAEPDPIGRIDYHALPSGAKPHFLGPYLGTLVGGLFPRLCWETSDVALDRLTYIFTGGPADATTWRQRLPEISAWLGGQWSLETTTANTLTLVRRMPLPDTLPFMRTHIRNGAIYLGIDAETHQTATIPFSEMTSGTLIPGASGTGKSNALHIIVQSLLANLGYFEAIYLVDGKDGVAFNRYRHAAPGKVHVLWTDQDVWKLMGELTTLMKRRNEAQREQNIDNATRDFIAVVIDEMATFTAKPSSDSKNPDNKLHAKFVDDLTNLARRGRSTGLRLIISAQEPVVEQIPASIRANCQTSIVFRLPVDAHATAMFGQLDGLPADPRKLLRGHALIKNGLSGEIRHVQFPVVRR